MPSRARAIAGDFNVGLLLFLMVWCAWPDVTLAVRMVTGFRISGDIESPPIFRQLAEATPCIDADENMKGAAAFVDKLEKRARGKRDPDADAAVHKLVLKDIAKGFMRKGHDRIYFDEKYGVGKWLPLIRFAIEQGFDEHGNWKWRAIDDGSAANTNDMAKTQIKVHTTTIDGIISIAKHMRQRWLDELQETHEEASLEAAVEDESSAFRFKPTSEADAHLLIIAAFDPKLGRMQYHEILGHPFGVGAAVTNYNRGAVFATHVSRVLLSCMTVHYYDDALMLAYSTERGWAQGAYRKMQTLFGTALDAGKSQLMTTSPSYVGVVLALQQVLSHGQLKVKPKPGRVDNVQLSIQDYDRRDQLSAPEAAKFMGRCGFLGSHCAGNLLRGCTGALAKRAHENGGHLS